MPNMMMAAGAADSSNYLDVRNETHFQDQGTFRVDNNFANGDTLLARYSAGGENGFSPSSGMTATTENLPGFGVNFNNLSQQAVGSWNHVFASNRINTISLAVSRLSMDRTSQNDGVNDIVSALGIQGIGFGERTLGAHRGSPFRDTRESVTLLPQRPCMLGTRRLKCGIAMHGSAAATP